MFFLKLTSELKQTLAEIFLKTNLYNLGVFLGRVYFGLNSLVHQLVAKEVWFRLVWMAKPSQPIVWLIVNYWIFLAILASKYDFRIRNSTLFYLFSFLRMVSQPNVWFGSTGWPKNFGPPSEPWFLQPNLEHCLVLSLPGELIKVGCVLEELREAGDALAPLHQLGVQLQGRQQETLSYLVGQPLRNCPMLVSGWPVWQGN